VLIRQVLATALGLVIATAHGLSAQSAPAAADADAQPADTASEDPGVVQKIRKWAADTQLIERLNGGVDGWYPRIGGITRGSGFAGGPGIRGPVVGTLYLDLSGAVSIRKYKAVDARLRWLQTRDKRVELWTDFRYEDFPQEDFFGLGMTSTPEMRTSYDFDSADMRVRTIMRPVRWARVTGTLGYMRPDVGSGADDQYPSTEEVFTDAEAPGLLDQPNFLHATIAGEIDYRDTGGNPSSGGLYRASYGEWNDVTLDQFDFRRFDMRLVQFVPLAPNRQHVLSGTVGTSYVNNAVGHRVPFYFLAYVGGMDTIRSFREFRFKDENALWLSAEYKWRPRRSLSLSVFADAGEARADWEDVDLQHMRTGYGVGFGFHSSSQTLARIDVGTGGGEGWQFFLKIRPSF
jgi:hypothetical protein